MNVVKEGKGNYRWWVLISLAFGLLAVGLDLTILNLALPTLATDLQATGSELQWFADAYTLVFAAALLPAGLLGDRMGRKKMLLAGLIVFGGASLLCAYADSSGGLIAGRALLGLGAAMLVPLSMSIIPVLFSEEERSKAIGVWVMANAIGIPLGPIIGGWLLNHFRWGSVFLINLPLVAISFVAVSVLMKESRSLEKIKIDFWGVAASSLGLIAFTFGFIEAGEKGWNDPISLATIVFGACLLIGFVYGQRRASSPLIEPQLFRSPSFTWGSIMATLVSFAMFGLLFVLPQYYQAVQGADALGAGLRLLPLIAGLIVGSKVTDRVQPRLGAWAVIAGGCLLLAAGLFFGANTTVGDEYSWTVVWVALAGLGIGFVLPASMDIAMSALTAERSGVGSALIMALRNVGGTLGVAILGTVLSAGYRGKLVLDGLPNSAVEAVERSASAGAAVALKLNSANLLDTVQAAFIHGMDRLLWVCGGVAVAGALLAILYMRPQLAKAAIQAGSKTGMHREL